MGENAVGNGSIAGIDGLADEDANLMIKLKFLTYKVHLYELISSMCLYIRIQVNEK